MKRIILFTTVIGLTAMLPAFGDLIYSNATADSGVTAAYLLNYGNVVSDTFTVTNPATVSEVDLTVWTDPGDPLTNVDWSIGTAAYGSDVDSAVSAPVTTESVCGSCQYGEYDVDSVAITGLDVSLAAGTYYLTLQNGLTTSSGPLLFWDVSYGPSLASINGGGQIPSETFELYGEAPEPGTWMMVGSALLALGFRMRNKLLVTG